MIRSAFKSLLPPCAALLLGGATLCFATDGFRALTEEAARRLHAEENRPTLPVFALQDMNGQPLRLGQDAAEGRKTTLVGFIYTSCPTICRAAGSDFAKLRDSLKELQLQEQVRLLSVSFDPARDDPRQMRSYAEQHGADGVLWTVARPRAEALPAVMKSFGLRIIPDDWGGYQHNAAIHVVDQKGRLTGIFDNDDIDGVLNAVQGKL